MHRKQRLVSKHLQARVKNSILYLVLFTLLIICVMGVYKGGVKLITLQPEHITLKDLPYALTLSLLRMTSSYIASLFFAFLLGFPAARTKLGERIIIPILDILQSVPVVGFFPAAISFFIGISNGRRFGVELAAIFLIFTSQAWNMAFAVYEAVKSIPNDQFDAVTSFGLKGSQKFWRLFAPACAPRLVYNSILSWSNGWFFLVACEIIAVGPISYHLPGIGSFLARAAEQDQPHLVFWGLAALTTLIVSLDFLFWRPTSDWAERFKYETSGSSPTFIGEHVSIPHFVMSQVSPIFEPTSRLLRALFYPLFWLFREVLLPLIWDLPVYLFMLVWNMIYGELLLKFRQKWFELNKKITWLKNVLTWTLALAIIGWGFYNIGHWLRPPWPPIAHEIPKAILASTKRLIIALSLSLLWIIPISLYTSDKPKFRRWLTTVAQVGASLPAVALFPLFIIVVIKKLGGGMEIASILLLITGMQWYPLFNCLGGVSTIPNELTEATQTLGLSRLKIWQRLTFPAMRPALITGCITAWGGGWNALVVSEYVSYKGHILTVNGLGSLLSRSVYQLGDHRSITFCIGAMVGWIVAINLLFWQPLYRASVERYKFDV